MSLKPVYYYFDGAMKVLGYSDFDPVLLTKHPGKFDLLAEIRFMADCAEFNEPISLDGLKKLPIPDRSRLKRFTSERLWEKQDVAHPLGIPYPRGCGDGELDDVSEPD